MYIDKFDKWYDSLTPKQQAEVDDLADDLGYNLYEDCADYELAHLMEMYWNDPAKSVKASYDPTEADTYVVKIWYEVEPEYDAPNDPEAAEEIIEVVANSPQQAKEYALMQWDGPVDRIEIVDVNPDYTDEYFPFEACSDISSSSSVSCSTEFDVVMSQLSFDFIHYGNYVESKIEDAVYDALAASGCKFEASSFESVDYSNSPEFRDEDISQMSVDFTWDKYEGYDSESIMREIESRMWDLGYEVIGYDFRSLD